MIKGRKEVGRIRKKKKREKEKEKKKKKKRRIKRKKGKEEKEEKDQTKWKWTKFPSKGSGCCVRMNFYRIPLSSFHSLNLADYSI